MRNAMSVAIGHPTGNPNAFNAALAYWENEVLEAFCLPWLPAGALLSVLRIVPGIHSLVDRLERRTFEPLRKAPLRQDRLRECCRLASRWLSPGRETERRCSAEVSIWIERTLCATIAGERVRAVHVYEDCVGKVFEVAKTLGRARILEMPTCHAAYKQRVNSVIAQSYREWLPDNGQQGFSAERIQQKRAEIAGADLVMVASEFAAATIREEHPEVKFGFAPYGVDLHFWRPRKAATDCKSPLRVVFVGQVTPAKGVPHLIEAWRRADLFDAELCLVGNWGLSESAAAFFPKNVTWKGARGPREVRDEYQRADLMVFPSYYEGFGLVILEAMACGLPVICSRSTAGPELLTDACGWLYEPGDVDRLADLLQRAVADRERLQAMGRKARERAEEFSWSAYRQRLFTATSSYCHHN
jgi:glycosyltransferase involved in cell wall biosynthesis